MNKGVLGHAIGAILVTVFATFFSTTMCEKHVLDFLKKASLKQKESRAAARVIAAFMMKKTFFHRANSRFCK